jgi:hypothetical protein
LPRVFPESSLLVLVRAIAPSLFGADLSDVLANPTVDLLDAKGAVLASNDDWKTTQIVAISGERDCRPMIWRRRFS